MSVEESSAAAPQRIALVVDDNPTTRYATSRVMRSAGFEIREAETGAQALARASGDVAVVILDVHLPDTDGFEVSRVMRERRHLDSVPIVHLSAAFVDQEDKVRGLESGADAYLTHPADPPLLIATVNALIRARRAEGNMRLSEARFRGIYDLAHSGIVLVDGGGRIMECNQAFLNMLDCTSPYLDGRPLSELAPPDVASAVAAHLRNARREPWHGEFPLLDCNGKHVDIAWSISAHVEVGVLMAIATDISERVALGRQREELLEREQAARASAERLGRTKGELVAVLSHELRTPLNAIMTWAHVLQHSTTQLAKGLEVIVRNAKAQSRLISDILDASRLDVGKLRLDLSPVNLRTAVNTAVESLESSFTEKSLQVESFFEGYDRSVIVDVGRLQQVIWNLLTNAIKFSEPGGLISLHTRISEQRAQISITDKGQGISAGFLPYLFERFSQGDASSNRIHGGLGLGLSIVKHLVELHDGTIEVVSAGEGQGATFLIDLPVNGPRGTQSGDEFGPTEAGSLGATSKLEGLRILVVEDDTDSLDIATMVLREQGAEVTPAIDAEEALLLAAQSWPDALVSDIGLPGSDGYTLIAELRRVEQRESKPRLRAIALTAFSRPQDRERALKAGFDTHCGKPLDPSELVNVLAKPMKDGLQADA